LIILEYYFRFSNILRNFEKFEIKKNEFLKNKIVIKKFETMLGGFIYSLGFFCTVASIKMCGIGLGTLIWCITSMFIGWSTARFGLFGAEAEVPTTKTKDIFNYIGISLCLLGIVQSSFIKIEEIDDQNDRIRLKYKRLIGSLLAMIVGTTTAFSFTPILYVQNHYKDANVNMNTYAFSMYTGSLFGGILIFLIYSLFKRNKPNIYPESILPGLFGG
jgi:uncharacterized membrane protein YdcZ (DUF606 family)